jgi:hypothetical protein
VLFLLRVRSGPATVSGLRTFHLFRFHSGVTTDRRKDPNFKIERLGSRSHE